jgi:hypothetical protein
VPEYLLTHGVLHPADLEAAREAAAANERSGKSELARKRLKYKPRK